jgi:hypothetical protein
VDCQTAGDYVTRKLQSASVAHSWKPSNVWIPIACDLPRCKLFEQVICCSGSPHTLSSIGTHAVYIHRDLQLCAERRSVISIYEIRPLCGSSSASFIATMCTGPFRDMLHVAQLAA